MSKSYLLSQREQDGEGARDEGKKTGWRFSGRDQVISVFGLFVRVGSLLEWTMMTEDLNIRPLAQVQCYRLDQGWPSCKDLKRKVTVKVYILEVWFGFEPVCACVRMCVRALHLGVETEVAGQDVAAGQAVCLAVALSRITQTEQQQNQHRLHGSTVWQHTEQTQMFTNGLTRPQCNIENVPKAPL